MYTDDSEDIPGAALVVGSLDGETVYMQARNRYGTVLRVRLTAMEVVGLTAILNNIVKNRTCSVMGIRHSPVRNPAEPLEGF